MCTDERDVRPCVVRRVDALLLRHEGLTVALDDLGAADALFSFDAVAGTDVLKFDRAVVARLREPRARYLFSERVQASAR